MAENDVKKMNLKLIGDLKRAEEKRDSFEEMYGCDDERVMSAYIEYEHIRSSLTELEALFRDFKLTLIVHYTDLLFEKMSL